jgi:hypothetical protein
MKEANKKSEVGEYLKEPDGAWKNKELEVMKDLEEHWAEEVPLSYQSRQVTSAAADSASLPDQCVAGGALPLPERAARSSHPGKPRRLIPTVIIDKSALFRAGLALILTGSQFRVTANCSSLYDLSERVVDELRLALISLDGEVAADLSRVASLAERGVRVILLSDRFRGAEMLAAIEAGAVGYLVKNEISPVTLVK